MSTKATFQQTRRTPLSLTGGVGKQHHQSQHGGKSSDSNGNSNNSPSAKNQKNNTNQKTESNNTDVRESTPKEVKKQQNAEKKQMQQQNPNNEAAAASKNEKLVDEKKTQNSNGNGKAAATNGGAKEKHQNGNDKQDATNGGSNTTKSGNTNANGSAANAKTIATKTNEKTPTVAAVKEEAKSKGRKTPQPFEKTEKEAANEDEKETKKDGLPEKEKNEDTVQEKVVEKETRSRRHEAAASTEREKRQTEKAESVKAEEAKREVSTPTSRSSSAQSKSRFTPTGVADKSGSSTPTKPVENKSNLGSQRNKTVTTVIDDADMEPIVVNSSPEKPVKEKLQLEPVAVAAPPMQPPTATSTPGKALRATQKSTQPTIDAKPEIPINIPSRGNSPNRNSVPRTFTQIGGRRSIRPLNEYTPSKFQSNSQFRESYRRINTELDVSSTTNTSMNVTVGSEVPNNSSFSFFGRGRKRERTPPQHSQSAMEVQTDADYSPPKRARLDMYSLFSVVSSPLTMLRSRFSRASIQSSTPVKLASKLASEDEEAEVQNVSGISIEEEQNEGGDSEDKTATEEVTVSKKTDDGNDTTPNTESPTKVDGKCDMEKGDVIDDELMKEQSNSSDVHEVAAGVADTSFVSAKPKNKCNIM